MGDPTSTILSEVYIHLLKHQIIGYFRYANDILILYNQKKTNIDETVAEFSKQRTSIKFAVEKRTTQLR
jgi:hypothetical protein